MAPQETAVSEVDMARPCRIVNHRLYWQTPAGRRRVLRGLPAGRQQPHRWCSKRV